MVKYEKTVDSHIYGKVWKKYSDAKLWVFG